MLHGTRKAPHSAVQETRIIPILMMLLRWAVRYVVLRRYTVLLVY